MFQILRFQRNLICHQTWGNNQLLFDWMFPFSGGCFNADINYDTNEELLLNLSHEICSSTLLQSYQGIYSVRSLVHITTRELSTWLLSMVRDYFWKYVYKQRTDFQFFYNCFKSNFILLTLKMHSNIHEVQTNGVWFQWYKKYLLLLLSCFSRIRLRETP